VKKYGFKFEGGKLVKPGTAAPASNGGGCGDGKAKKFTKVAGKKRKAAEAEDSSHDDGVDDNSEVKDEA
jgi:hypothetical protein